MNFTMANKIASVVFAGGALLSSLGQNSLAASIQGTIEPAFVFQAFDNPLFPTFAFDVNRHGTVVGYYYDSNSNAVGYLRSKDGKYTNLVYPKTPTVTYAQATNDVGNVAGYGRITGLNNDYGWFYEAKSQTFTAVEVPNADATDVWGLNNHNVVAGTAYFYSGWKGRSQGFTWYKGVFKYYRIPEATYTSVYAINDQGDVAGSYIEASGASHDFIWKADGTIQRLDPVNEFNNMAGVAALNDSGDFVGPCFDQDYNTIGCLYEQRTAKVTSFKLEGFSSTIPYGMAYGAIVGTGVNATTGTAQAYLLRKSRVLEQ